MPFSLFLALRYLRPKRTFMSLITLLSTFGVMLPVAVILIVISVMAGFGEMWRDKILGFNAHLTVTNPRGLEGYESMMQQVSEMEGVQGVGPFIQGLVFINHHDVVNAPFLRGLDPDQEAEVTGLDSYIKFGEFSLEDDEVILGLELARSMGIRVGDEILVYSPQSFASQDEIVLPEELTVSGIFEVGMFDIDNQFMLSSLDTAREITGMEEGVHGLQVMLDDPFKVFSMKEQLKNDLGPFIGAYTWMELNQQLFTALQTEKNVMFFILIVIASVSGMLVVITLLTVTFQKIKEIGLMKAVGVRKRSIMGVFIWYGLIMSFVGTILGIGLGLLLLRTRNDLLNWINQQFDTEILPAAMYQLGEIPAQTSSTDILIISLSVIALSVLSACLPAWWAAKQDPVRSLRYE